MKKNGLETWLYSSLGVAAMFGILILINALGSQFKKRIDLTQEHAYTLSAGTRAILAKLDTPVQIRFYRTGGDENRMPVQLRTYAQQIEDLLDEYKQLAKGNIEIQKLDPAPDSDAEDSAKLDGVQGQPRIDGEPVYLGLSVSMLDHKETIAFLAPSRERLLEYDISRAISRVVAPEKPVVGFMSPLPYMGMPASPMRPGGPSMPPWTFYSELKRDFDVRNVDMNVDKIPDEIKTLVLVHPAGIGDAALFALDQFVLRGGKLLAFLDPQAALASSGPMMGGNEGSNLAKLLSAWGIAFDSQKVVADLNNLAQTREGRQPVILALTENAFNREDPLAADANELVLAFAGGFTGTPAAGLTQSILIHSSTNSQLVDPMEARFGAERIIQNFDPSNKQQALAVRLSGKFKTAFPEGKPKAATPQEEKKDGKDGNDQKDAKDSALKESTGEGVVVLVGDSDFLQDPLCVQQMQNPFGGRVVVPSNGNLAFIQGAVEQLTGDDNLIRVRSRASRDRQFTVVKEIQARAEAAYRNTIKSLETSLAEAQSKISALQQAKGDAGGKHFILSPEQQAEIAKVRKKEAEVKLQLKQERKKLRADIDSLENRIEWLNIGLMPGMVACVGLGLAIVRHNRRAAR